MIDNNSPIYPFINQLYEEDCIACMKRFPDHSIDMILCDLPYGMTQNQWDSYIPLEDLWEQYTRIIKPNGVIALTSQGLFTARLILSQPKLYKYKWIWEKSKPTNFLNAKKQPLRKHEDICIFYNKQPVYNPQMKKGEPYDKGIRKNQLSGSYGDFQPVHVHSDGERYPTDILYVKTAESEGDVVHPTQKPIELGRYFVRTYTNPGDVVLDNTFGSGSFLVAALMEGRNFIGIEKNEDVALFKKDNIDYIEVAKKRLYLAWEGLDKKYRQTVVKNNLISDFRERRTDMKTIVRSNERSWAIELIAKINEIARKNDLSVKRAGGESTISAGRGNTMFPDVVLYGNEEQTVILEGWEIKMPDVHIEDETFIKDAQRKAIALGLNSCLIWNFTYAALYIRNEDDTFRKVKQWSDTSHIHTRQDVKTYRADWEKLLETVILEINQYFISGTFRQSYIGDAISNGTITALVQRNKKLIADELRSAASKDAVLTAYIDNWWKEIKSEYENDESDPYSAYAKTVILNWANRIIFAHIIKYRQNGAMLIDGLDDDLSPKEANEIFDRITSRCDFYNVFVSIEYNDILPELSWSDFVELSLFLKNNGIEHLNQEALQDILENSVNTTKREIDGQFATPLELARILVRMTMRDYSGDFLDSCCGTGTISKAAIQIKKEKFSPKEAAESVWACDKYQYPLQAANISMVDADTINVASRLFQHDALTLKSGEKIEMINPETGDLMELELPEFDAIASNLPFVPFEIISEDDKAIIKNLSVMNDLDARSDLYCYIATKLSDMLKPNGMLGIITSNSWLGTAMGEEFVTVLKRRYDILQVHISGKGRWFKNADVVTTIMILRKKQGSAPTTFALWKKSLPEIASDNNLEDTLVNSALLEKELDPSVVALSRYSQSQMDALMSLNISYNSLFHKVNWLLDISDKAIRINEVFTVFRGSRRGWDALFYPQSGEHHIESMYIKKVLKNARNINTLTADADSDAFCCGKSISELERLGHKGALEWINKFEDQNNKVGDPLPQVLARSDMFWYEMRDNEIAEIFTMMNPDQRIFFAKFNTPSFVNQRLIGLKHTEKYDDVELNHALLNSVFTMFYIEASGFSRGLGVLDINKNRIANCYMLNPKLVTEEDRGRIIEAFEKLKNRPIKKVSEELRDKDRIEFERAVFESFGIEDYFESVCQSLLSMQRTRSTVKGLD